MKNREFESSYAYLVGQFSPKMGEEEASKLLDEAILSVELPKRSKYEIDDFIKICEELKKKGGRERAIGGKCIVQARCYETLRILAFGKK